MLESGRHRRITPAGQWQGVRPQLRRTLPGRHHRETPNTLRTKTLHALLPGATVIALAAVATPAHAAEAVNPAPAESPAPPVAESETQATAEWGAPQPVASQTRLLPGDSADQPPQIDPVFGLSQDLPATFDSLKTFSIPGMDLPGLDLPALFTPETAIVVLGYGLLPDGQMRPELMARLYAGYVSALLSPQAPVIVTGGNPQNGVTEADAMADWLVDHGIDRNRIHAETKANSTVQNAAFSAHLMDVIGAHAAILITSADHIARALTNFRAAGISVVATLTPDSAPLSAQPFGPGVR
ncbi:YdcF family protein [Nocardia tengchongensis]|uniref:YdcF family protein n=1 Tax=Nocardia tengchongensis TaxID=2055889 RepID=UPI001FE468E7|nr:YdcF family protein [Nocardia tengchongensis]